MRYEKGKDFYHLASGRRLYANNGILGISPKLQITEGYDGDVDCEDDLTADEKREIANHMADLWQEWAGVNVRT